MLRFAVLLVPLGLALGGCGNDVDERAATLPFITENVLVSACSASQCHSSMSGQDGYVFDTVDNARESLLGGGLVDPSDTDPTDSALIGYITGRIAPRMPYDAPFPTRDLDFLERWVTEGVPGAQCLVVGASACNTATQTVYSCDSDHNFGAIVQTCKAGLERCLVDHCQAISQP